MGIGRAAGSMVAALLACTACIATDPPGDSLGTFDVRAELTENSCGPTAVIAADSEYAIELRADAHNVYWQVLGGQPLVGDFDPEGHGSLAIDLRLLIQLYGPGEAPEPQLDDPLDFAELGRRSVESQGGCTLLQSEELRAELSAGVAGDAADGGRADAGDGSVDAGAPDAAAGDAGADAEPPGFTAVRHLHLSATPDSDCSAAMVARGGPFEKLPCDIEYELTALRRPR